MLLRIVSTLFIALFVSIPGIGHAQISRMEVIPLQSMTLTDQEFLSGAKGGKSVTVAGELRIPRAGSDRIPLVILLHGSSGVAGFTTDWEQELNSMGVATFVLDSFSGRGLVNVVNDQGQLGRLAQIYDAYRALDLFEKHPRIDPARIVIMGSSRGGQAALYSSVRRFQRMYGPASGREFAAYIALYPSCDTVYRNDEEVSTNPIRIFHGSADDYVPVAQCRLYAERLKTKGSDVKHTEYADAHHVFDWKSLKVPLKADKAQTLRHCELAEKEDGRIFNVKSMQPFTYSDPCVERGVTIAYNEKASTEARLAIKEFIATTIKP